MRRLIEMIMSLIVVAATYAIMHIIFISYLFNLTAKMPAYVPVALSVFTGFIFYFIASTTTANLLMKRMMQTEERLTKMNVKELAEMGEIDENSFDIIIPDVLAGKAVGRTDPKHRIYAHIIGTGMLDVACAGLLLQKLKEAGEEPFRYDITK